LLEVIGGEGDIYEWFWDFFWVKRFVRAGYGGTGGLEEF
jgi:hypothetical protein